MPWWTYIYLAIFLIISVIGLIDDLYNPKKAHYLAGGITSTLLGIFFVVGFYKITPSRELGWALVFALIFFASYEFISAKRDLQMTEPDHAMTEKENSAVNWAGTTLAMASIIPSFLFGVLLCFRCLNV